MLNLKYKDIVVRTKLATSNFYKKGLMLAVLFGGLFCFPAYAHFVTKDEAFKIIESFVGTNSTKSVGIVQGNTNSNLKSVDLPASLLTDGQEPFYIFSGPDSFFIVSSESDYGEILAYSEDNGFDMDNIAPSALYILEYYKKQIRQIGSNGPASEKIKTRSSGSSKLLKTACFGQNGYFWWTACPVINGSYCYAGCGAAAMAIVMKYYNWPSTGEGSNRISVNDKQYSVDFSDQRYSWNDIPLESPYSVQWSQIAKDEVAKILFHCGVAANSEYGTSGTSTNSLNIGPALINHFKYNVASNKTGLGPSYYFELRDMYSDDDSWMQMIRKEIDNDRPCILFGSSTYSTHIFVCDGYDESDYFHFNLGWSGTSNGYYSMNSVNDSYVVNTAIIGISPDRSKTDDNPGDNISSTQIDGHEYVDLGLPSGALWATSNYGASSPHSYGSYLSWDDVDIVTDDWGKNWETPSYYDVQELVTKCSWSETSQNGISGYNVRGPNGNSIFIPCAGWKINGYSNQVGQLVCYWTSTHSSGGNFAYTIYANGNTVEYNTTYNTEILSLPVRPISTLTLSDIQKHDNGQYEYVDLGLPSETCWATMNVGASSPEDFGSYFAWGETATKSNYEWATYKYCDGTENYMSKYTRYGETLSASDDAATVNWGNDWRMPTVNEMNELRSYCTWTFGYLNGIRGYTVTGPNGNSIFLPLAGMMNYQWHTNEGQGRYWTSSLAYDVSYASYLLFDSSSYQWYMVNRSYGHSVRPVYQGKKNSVEKLSTDNSDTPLQSYTIDGKKTDRLGKGINIVRMPDGSIKKVLY